ncbi:MAG: hypothetical protein H0T73_16575, partial [Ardenticatenales bacterium]|nr:hypothetical protein [Ardenticatenales bacterium]
MIQYIWLVPLLPLLGVIINTFFGRYLPGKTVAWLAAGLVGAGAAIAIVIAAQIQGQGDAFRAETV